MAKITESELLKEKIRLKEAELASQGKLLKDHFYITYESLKPINYVKKTVKDLFSKPGLKEDAVGAGIDITAGFAAKKLLTGFSHNPLIKLSGMLVESLVSSAVAKNPDMLKSIGNKIYTRFFKKEEKHPPNNNGTND